MTKFKVGDKVKIVFHPEKQYIGKVGVITEAIDSQDVVMEEESTTTGLYQVKVDDYTIPNYAEDDCISSVEGGEQ